MRAQDSGDPAILPVSLTPSDELLHLREGPLDALDHLLEALTVAEPLLDNLDVELPALSVTHADSVDHVVVRVLMKEEAKSSQQPRFRVHGDVRIQGYIRGG